eukprot:gb/GEZN01014256.1/.p1 GENE.gb/GEZN01014256.1/~~gb/GEZN01014256.1/.p1  ORF type:complete len:297 (-),score=27.40 gb/GEZN01014256.1/:46-936(-)
MRRLSNSTVFPAFYSSVPSAFTSCPIVYQDREVLVVDKPAGVLSHPNHPTCSASSRCAFVGAYDAAARRFDSPAGPVWLLHRLDQDTSGLLLAALDLGTAQACRTLFAQGGFHKGYFALAYTPHRHQPTQGTWRDCLVSSHSSGGRGNSSGVVRSAVRRGGQPNAELRYRQIANAPLPPQLTLAFPASSASSARSLPYQAEVTLLELELVTGRTHQIRLQAASRGLPLLGDEVYGNWKLNRLARRLLGARRTWLHAKSLSFCHPSSGQEMCLTSPLPIDLANVLAKLNMNHNLGIS